MLTGKDINLEKARQAALNNDLATVAEEIAKITGNSAGFAEMNRIQQEAIAKAVGMTREELAASLKEQEALKSMGVASVEEAQKKFDLLVEQNGIEGALAEMGENAITKQMSQLSLQEKANEGMKKMADTELPAVVNSLNVGINFWYDFDISSILSLIFFSFSSAFFLFCSASSFPNPAFILASISFLVCSTDLSCRELRFANLVLE